MASYTIVEDDLTGAEIASLLRLHLDEMHQWSPPESVHAMPIERLRAPDVTFYIGLGRRAPCRLRGDQAPG